MVKHIILGITGGVAAYKMVDLASKLTQAGWRVTTVLTQSAQQFVTVGAFEAVTGQPVYTDLWEKNQAPQTTHILHLDLAKNADLILIAPATANTLAKLAIGLADNLLTTVALSAECPILVAPAMEATMFKNEVTQQNLTTLQSRGYEVIAPVAGRFASGLFGIGRLPETSELMGHVRLVAARSGELAGKKVVVTAGGTQEPIDPVRVITNHSSGKQGFALAQAAIDLGAQVTLISATHSLPIPVGCEYVQVTTAAEMSQAVERSLPETDVLVMAAAVADFRVKQVSKQKIKKGTNESMTLELVKNPDILALVKNIRAQTSFPKVVVGFAAESQALIENATAKITAKNLDMIVANDISQSDAGFGGDNNRVVLIEKSGKTERFDLMTKVEVSRVVIEKVVELVKANQVANTV